MFASALWIVLDVIFWTLVMAMAGAVIACICCWRNVRNLCRDISGHSPAVTYLPDLPPPKPWEAAGYAQHGDVSPPSAMGLLDVPPVAAELPAEAPQEPPKPSRRPAKAKKPAKPRKRVSKR